MYRKEKKKESKSLYKCVQYTDLKKICESDDNHNENKRMKM